jgi:hypothetical protein
MAIDEKRRSLPIDLGQPDPAPMLPSLMFSRCELRFLVLTWAGLLVGCATSTSTMQRAQTLKSGHFEVQAAMGLPLSTNLIGEAITSASTAAGHLEDAEEEGRPITEDEQLQALETAMALVLFTPMPSTEFAARIGMKNEMDVGLRYAGSLIKADLKKMFINHKEGLDLSGVVGYAYHLGIGSSVAETAFSVVEFVRLGDYSRHDVDAAVIVGRDWGQWLTLYGSARTMVSFISLDSDIEMVETVTGAPSSSIKNKMFHAGGAGGLFIGKRPLFLTAELTVMRVIFRPTVLGEEIDLSGYMVTPTAGVTGRF